MGGKTRNIAIQLVLQQRCKTSCTFFVARFFRTFSQAFAFSDLDECTSSAPVCDVNADCINTHGSYFCTCKAGFSGDGKTCSRKEICLLSFLNKSLASVMLSSYFQSSFPINSGLLHLDTQSKEGRGGGGGGDLRFVFIFRKLLISSWKFDKITLH